MVELPTGSMNKVPDKLKSRVTKDVLFVIAYGLWYLFQRNFLVNGPLLLLIFLAIGILTAIFLSKSKTFYEALKKSAWIVLFILYLFYGINYLYVSTQKSEEISLDISGYSTYSMGTIYFKFREDTSQRPYRMRDIVERFGKDFPETCELKIRISQGIGCVFIYEMRVIENE
jgi:hypothetical protein